MVVKNLKPAQIIGLLGSVVCIIIFLRSPSWPTPDKLLVFLTFIFMTIGQAREMLKRLAPFVVLILAYESFRGIIPSLNTRVEYEAMIRIDMFLFGGHLPTHILQNWLWNGTTQWYDFALYLVYMLHFVLPFALAILIWKKRDRFYWQYVTTFIALSFAGFLTFLALPAAPPWLASDNGYIKPITRISSQVWASLGIQDFPSVYNKISPNPVAAVPSLHAAYATLFVIFVWKLFGKKWGIISLIYPVCIYFGTVYQGEHYLIDEILGGLYAASIYFLIRWLFETKHIDTKINLLLKTRTQRINRRLRSR